MKNTKITSVDLTERQKKEEGEEKRFYSIENILDISGRNSYFVTQEQRLDFCRALLQLPHNIIDFALNNIYFFTINPNEDKAETFYLKGKSAKRLKALTFIYPATWEKGFEYITDTIAHEIAHACLKHDWNSWLNTNNHQNEDNADKLASKWLGRKITTKQ